MHISTTHRRGSSVSTLVTSCKQHNGASFPPSSPKLTTHRVPQYSESLHSSQSCILDPLEPSFKDHTFGVRPVCVSMCVYVSMCELEVRPARVYAYQCVCMYLCVDLNDLSMTTHLHYIYMYIHTYMHACMYTFI
jgi:hypothetical protein